MKRLSWITLTLIALMLIAFLARAYHIGSISNQFHTTRQFYTAQMVRGDYFTTADVPDWKRAVAIANKPPALEPPFIQTVALIGYNLAGSEQLWIPRTFSALMWVIAAVFLFLTAKKIMRPESALVAVAFYLFVPYGLVASRSFQANPTMIALSVISYFTILHYIEEPSWKRLTYAVIATGLTNLVMIYVVFTIYPLFAWLMIQRHGGIRPALKKPDSWLFVFFSLLPAGLYYAYGFFIAGFLNSQTGALFNPNLWAMPIYWINWVAKIGDVVGYIPIILSIQAILTTRNARQSATLRSLWLGYLVYGFIINWPIMSHDYYSMPLIPIVALSLASVVDFIIVRLQTPQLRRWVPKFALAITTLITIYGLVIYLPTTTVTPELERELHTAELVGERVEHSTHTVFLAKDYGSLLTFYGEISGYSWPMTWDYNAARLAGKPTKTVEERFNEIIGKTKPDFFIVTDFFEYALQQDLAEYLSTHFTEIESTPDYIIYDLRMPLPDKT